MSGDLACICRPIVGWVTQILDIPAVAPAETCYLCARNEIGSILVEVKKSVGDSIVKLKLSDWSSLAEILSAIAVLISLVYVGVQVSDGTRAVRSASVNDASLAVQNWYQEMGSNPQMSDLFYRAMRSEQPLNDQEEFQFLMGFHSLFLGFQNNYLMSVEGTLDPSTRDAFINVALSVRDMPGFKRFWRQRKTYLHPEFADYVDGILTRDIDQDKVPSMDLYRLSPSKPD